ncbi:MAG: hypothetical protein IPP49_14900 [Saprospiraceae bacterium]|nr:hypothetical protein [Saprospiraceae bacterium]
MFTILSWNILQGGGSRAMQLLQHIGDLKPTVCILSEFRNNDSGAAIRLGLLKHGYRHQFVTDAPRDENSVLIASLMACSNQIHPLSDPVFSGSILSVHFEVFSIMGVYLPHKKKHVLFDYILKHVQQVEKPYIIAGDFNSGLNRIDQEGSSFWYEDKLKALDAQGYKDAFRHKHLEAKNTAGTAIREMATGMIIRICMNLCCRSCRIADIFMTGERQGILITLLCCSCSVENECHKQIIK